MKVAPTYFADTSFWISLLEAGDQYHARALAWEQHVVASHALVATTEAVMWEMLNYFAIPAARSRAIRLYHACRNKQEILVHDFQPERTEAALRLYESRPDKSWGMTDCLSFETMRIMTVTQALTADHHFEQAGFEALLLRDPVPSP
jgi:predicted nucleic acid-binding protein